MKIYRYRRRSKLMQSVRGAFRKCILSKHTLWFRRKFSRSHTKQWTWKRKILWGAGGIFGGIFLYGLFFLPSVDDAEQFSFAESTIIYDREALNPEEDPNDHILYVIHGDENREYVPLEEIPKHMIDATIAIEDDSFYGHIGFDIGGIIKATLNHLFGIGSQRGGSTITQQLVKNTFLSDIAYDRTISRKLKEILLSVKVELNYSKDEILELYLNNIPYGHNAHGIETASKTFFGKSARELTLAESAVLASLPVAPTRFSPYGTNKDLLMGWYETDLNTGEQIYKKGRKDLVLQRMLDLKKITFEEFKQAFSEAKEIEFKRYRSDIQAPHFVFYVRERLEEKYGKEFLKNGGLRIYTTLDPKLQQDAEEVIATKSAHYEDTYGAKNVALASINPENGEILAYVGGKDFFDTEHDGQVDVLTSRRQPGSSFKPFVYASAFEQGYTPSTVLFDTETDFGGNYQPQNFDGEFLGPVSMRESLNRSLNIPAVKTAFLARPENVLKLASRLGIKYEGNAEIHNVAVGIGVAEVEPLSHINAFQVFVGDGSWYEPTAILEVHNSDGTVLETFDPLRTRHEGLDPEIAALVRHVLTDESTRPTTEGFDWNNLLQLPEYNNGAKTGTSNRKTENPEFDENKPEDDEENPKFITTPGDSWTIGFTPHLVTGVWVGNNRGEPMKQGSTGLAVAAPIWKRFMLDAHEILVSAGADPEKLYHEPTPLEVRPVNKFTGRIATDLTPPRLVREEVFPSFAIPTELDDSVQTIEVDKVSGRPVTPFTPFYSRTRQYALTGLKSIRPDLPHWQEPVEEWLHTHPKFLTSLGTIMDEDPKETRNIFSRQTSRLSNLSDNPRNQFSQVNAPTIRITSPKNGGIVARGQVEITTSITAPQEMRAVEFYLNDQLVADATRSPWNGKFQIPSTTPEGEKQVIRAIAIDQLFNIGESEIEVTIAPDQKGPEITFLGPVGKQRIPLGTKMQILADVRDEESGVKLVEFFKDEQSLGFTESPPYERSFRAEGSLGTHEIKIKAWDLHGNVSEKTIPVLYERERLLQSGSPEISDIYSYRSSISVDAIFPEYENIEWVELVAEQKETILFSEKIELPPQSAQFQIPKNQGGKTTLRLITKFKGNNKLHESPIRKVDL